MPINKTTVSRRTLLKGVGASAAAATIGLPRVAFAAPKTIKIGLVQPTTGPLAFFTEHIPFVLDQVKKTYGGNITVNGTAHPYEIVVRDSQSNPNRASEVTQDLILNEKCDVIAAFATPETVNPVSDQCEVNGVPCITNDAPLEPYFFGRKGDPAKGFDWTYHFFFSASQIGAAVVPLYNRVETNKNIGAVWPNDDDGNAFAHVFPPIYEKAGYKVTDPGRFDLPASNYTAQIAAFKSGGAELVHGVLSPPEFTTFWTNCAQQGYQPKVVYVGKATEFPAAIDPLGDRAINLSIEVWWHPHHPFKSGMTGQSSQELADEYEKVANRQWSFPLGHRHAHFELIFDVLKRVQDLDKPESIRDAIKTTDYQSIVGPINFAKGELPNCSNTPIVMAQWRKGAGKWPHDIVIVDNTTYPSIATNGEPEAIKYS